MRASRNHRPRDDPAPTRDALRARLPRVDADRRRRGPDGGRRPDHARPGQRVPPPLPRDDQAGDRPGGRRTRRLPTRCPTGCASCSTSAPPPGLPVVPVDVTSDGRRPHGAVVSTGSTTREPQTRIGNLGKLTRFEHRTKTHGPGWRHRQPEPGVHVWRTPHGYRFRVDATGTHFLGRGLRQARPPGSRGPRSSAPSPPCSLSDPDPGSPSPRAGRGPPERVRARPGREGWSGPERPQLHGPRGSGLGGSCATGSLHTSTTAVQAGYAVTRRNFRRIESWLPLP